MYLIVGLGNPDSKYLLTRHNMGFWAIDELSQRCKIGIRQQYALGVYGQGRVGGQDAILVKPTTYMNNSGVCVADLARRHRVPDENIFVIYDDVDLPVGTLRVRSKGGPGTHNGMRSVVDELGGEDFPRVRIGIGRPEGQDIVGYVLGVPDAEERAALMDTAQRAARAVEEALRFGLEAAMRHFHQ
ncbi:MAG: aminoacyl-tRNA hydrolase [Eubacteriales bacterium]|nr:aminoacyl-tRNA hydrolase [Eubacteriales bacterium]